MESLLFVPCALILATGKIRKNKQENPRSDFPTPLIVYKRVLLTSMSKID
jgi:hypothetical protein